MGDLSAALKTDNREFDNSPVTPENLGELIALVDSGEISGKIAKDVFAKMYATGDAPQSHR